MATVAQVEPFAERASSLPSPSPPTAPDQRPQPGSDSDAVFVLDGTERGLDPRARRLWSLTWSVPLLVLGLGGLISAVVLAAPAWVLAAIGVGTVMAVAAMVVWAGAVWKRWRWRVWEDALELTHGVVVRRGSLVPFHRIQQIDVRRGPLERLMGLASLEVHTAAATSDAVIPAVRLDQAEPLRRALLTRAGVDDAA